MRKAVACLLAVTATFMATLIPSGAAVAGGSVPPGPRAEALKAERNAAAAVAADVHAKLDKAEAKLDKVTASARKVEKQLEQATSALATMDQRLEVLGQLSGGMSHGMLTGIFADLFEVPAAVERNDLAAKVEALTTRNAEHRAAVKKWRKEAGALADRAAEADDQHARLARRYRKLADQRPEIIDVSPTLVEVAGITVHRSIGNQLRGLIWHARADGLDLGGYGYRSTQRQIELRRINGCPNVWRSSPSSCRIPTARPGTSMHETGLAIDFTINGDTVCFPRSAAGCPPGNPAFSWLRTHAPSYGLKNLPSEAWHWSTTGR